MNRSRRTTAAIKMVGVLLVCALGVGCASTTQMTGTWTAPDFRAAPADKILVLGIGASDLATRMFENAMAAELDARGLTAVRGSTVFPINAPVDTLALQQFVMDNEVDLLSVTRLVDISESAKWVSGSTTYVPVAAYSHFGGYYGTAFVAAHEPGHLQKSTAATVETNVYVARSGKLVWSGQSRTVDPLSVDDAVYGISRAMATSMAKSGIFGQTAGK